MGKKLSCIYFFIVREELRNISLRPEYYRRERGPWSLAGLGGPLCEERARRLRPWRGAAACVQQGGAARQGEEHQDLK